jgi:hypothetical protein
MWFEGMVCERLVSGWFRDCDKKLKTSEKENVT